MSTNQDFFNRALPKWPACVVVGDPITPEQAMEVLIRTDSWDISTNDQEWEELVSKTAGLPSLRARETASLSNTFAQRDRFRQDYQILQLYYLHNDRIASSYLGGPHGWCNWDGTVLVNDMNIGKWPSVQRVFDEWSLIAEAFPFLKLRCQLFDAEYGEDNPQPVVQFNVDSGKVIMSEPTEKLTTVNNLDSHIQRLWDVHRERGCSIEKLQEALAYVRAKVKAN